MMYYVLIKRAPRGVCGMSTLVVGADLEGAKKSIVEEVFGVGLPNTSDELLERYNLDVVELDEEWEKKFDDYAMELACQERSLV